jgi:hypothetical protein
VIIIVFPTVAHFFSLILTITEVLYFDDFATPLQLAHKSAEFFACAACHCSYSLKALKSISGLKL